MFKLKNTPSPELTWMNMLVSGAALLLACAAFIAFDMITFRQTMLRNLSTQAQIIVPIPLSALLFNDPQSAEILCWPSRLRPISCPPSLRAGWAALCLLLARSWSLRPCASPIPSGQTETHWTEDDQIALVRLIRAGREADWGRLHPIRLAELHSRFQR